ncbi:hypothetical protein MMC30_000858 [Trapelia coarctata]|nr:hypothetical protein [Trapelia coarctata]
MLRYTHFVLFLPCIFLILSFSALAQPNHKVTCHQKSRPVDRTFQQDCSNLVTTRVLGSRGPLGGSSVWEEKVSASSQPQSTWSTSSASCVIGFSAPRPLSLETWNAIKSAIEAVVNECADHTEPGGSRLQVSGRLSRRALTEQEEKALRNIGGGTFGIILYNRHGRYHPRLAAGVLYGSVALLGKGFGDLAAAASSRAITPGQRGTKTDELRRRSFDEDSMANQLFPRTKTNTSSSKVTCHPRVQKIGKAFQNDCGDILQKHIINGPGPLGGSAGWEEEKFPGSQVSIWSTSSKSCIVSFSVPRPLPGNTWTSIKSDIQAIASECVTQNGVGGSRGDFGDPIHGKQPKYPLVWITQSSQHASCKVMCRTVRFRNVGSLTPAEQAIQMACWKMYGGVAFAAMGGFFLPTNPALATGFYINGARVGFQGAAEFHQATRQQHVPRDVAMQFLVGQSLRDRVSGHFGRRHLCRAVRFRKAATLTEREKKIRSACWQMYGGSAWAAAGVGMIPIEPRLATGFLFAGASLGVHGAMELGKIEKHGAPHPEHASTKVPHRRSHLESPEPVSLSQTHSPLIAPQTTPNHLSLLPRSPEPEPRYLHLGGLCTEVFKLNARWLTREQHKMRVACMKMLGSSAALSLGGFVGPDSKVGKGLLAGGTALGAQGAYQYGRAKVDQIARSWVEGLLPSDWKRS